MIRIAGLLLALSALLAPAAAEPLTLRLDWTAYGAHAPFFLALERGYYRDAGIELTILEGQGSGTVVKAIGQGTEPVGFVDYATVLRAVSQGVPVEAVLGVIQRSPYVVISHGDAPIRTPRDLVGRTIAMAPGEAAAQIFPALLAAAGVDAGAVTIVTPAGGAKLALFLQRRVDAIVGTINFQVPQLELQGTGAAHFSYADFGVDTLAQGIAVNRDYLKSHEALLRRFLAATVRGWSEARRDPAAATEALLQRFPQYRGEAGLRRRELELTQPGLATSHTAGRPLGWMAREDWQATEEILATYAGLAPRVPVEQCYTNDYVP